MWWKSTNTFQEIVLTSPESAVSSTPYSTVILTFDVLTPNCVSSVHLCPKMHRWCKFGENVSNTLQDIMVTTFRDAHIDARTHGRTGQKQYPVCLQPHYTRRRHNKNKSLLSSRHKDFIAHLIRTSQILPIFWQLLAMAPIITLSKNAMVFSILFSCCSLAFHRLQK